MKLRGAEEALAERWLRTQENLGRVMKIEMM